MTIRLLLIDDSPLDRELFIALMTGDGDTPWLRNVVYDQTSKPLDNLEDYRKYDGVILDYNLRGPMTGYEVAKQINGFDWHIPIVILTGLPPSDVPVDVHDYVDYVTVKQIVCDGRQHDDQFGITRAFGRWLARIRDAKRGETLIPPQV